MWCVRSLEHLAQVDPSNCFRVRRRYHNMHQATKVGLVCRWDDQIILIYVKRAFFSCKVNVHNVTIWKGLTTSLCVYVGYVLWDPGVQFTWGQSPPLPNLINLYWSNSNFGTVHECLELNCIDYPCLFSQAPSWARPSCTIPFLLLLHMWHDWHIMSREMARHDWLNKGFKKIANIFLSPTT